MILASTGKISTMADGTMRICIDVEPRHAQEAFSLFGAPGTPCVIARLTQEAATAHQQAETVAAYTDAPANAEKPAGGPLARLAGQWCNDKSFLLWLASIDTGIVCTSGRATDYAAQYIRHTCAVQSRAELDHDAIAAQRFHEQIRLPYMAWRQARVVA